MKKNISIGYLVILILLSIVAGKIVRHTIMHENLVKVSVGWKMLESINNGDAKFGFTIGSDGDDSAENDDEKTSNATINAAAFFNAINIFGLDTYYGFEVYITVLWNLFLLAILFFSKKEFYSLKDAIFICTSIAVLNIFCFCPSKEPIQMLYFMIFFIIIIQKIPKKTKILLLIAGILLSVVTFRVYYALILIFGFFVFCYFEFFALTKSKSKVMSIVLAFVGIGITYFLTLTFLEITGNSNYSEFVRVRLRTSDAVSDIRAIFMSNNHFILTIDYLIILIRMIFPIELLKLGPKYIPYIIYQFYITYLIIKNLKNIKNITDNQKLATYLYLAFLFTSATFEPDFGSWIRHEAVTYPILLINFDILNKNNI